MDLARRSGAHLPFSTTTAYVNTIPPHLEDGSPGDAGIEERIRTYVRWNAMAMVVRANRGGGDLGGHIASSPRSSTMMEIGFNHFWRAPTENYGGDLIYFQGHSRRASMPARILEGRLTEEQLTISARRSTARASRRIRTRS